MKKTFPFLALFIPLLVMAAWAAVEFFYRETATTVEFKIEGYDPRDLLSGHYIQYRVAYGDDDCSGNLPASSASGVCKCLKPGPDGLHIAYWTGACDQRNIQACPLFIKGSCQLGSRFVAGIERMYFSEDLAPQLAQVPEKSTIRVGVTKSGKARVQTLLINGVEFEQALKRP